MSEPKISELWDVRSTPLGQVQSADTLSRVRPQEKRVPMAAFNASL